MRAALEKQLIDIPYQLTILDVDQDPDLLALYDELVPVLCARLSSDVTVSGAGQQLCHYFLDGEKVNALIESTRNE
ncbi:Glutaredoxin-like domain (DUF836) [Solimicrobium silvestre]|uniref:Glutaredoxin-like domain (DUF836) n=2 Tax=Solimicrobium silvestre TaxID=2099400 RepID=A0A2S9GWX9_9BURK|nr:Glutaredoxin-like domain (DUF836) [Solimicrobium silvestre]